MVYLIEVHLILDARLPDFPDLLHQEGNAWCQNLERAEQILEKGQGNDAIYFLIKERLHQSVENSSKGKAVALYQEGSMSEHWT